MRKSRQKLEAQEAAEREGDSALTAGIHILAIDFHLGAMMNDALDHRSHLGRGRRFQLGMDTQRIPFDVPVNHDAPSAISNMPLRRQVLIPAFGTSPSPASGMHPPPNR
jgi:hypothetical protein